MRITGWHIDAFGAITDAGVRELPDGLVVVLGPNASGKSTTLAFIRRTLFGYPHRNRKDVNHYEPIKGGRRGGRLYCDADGEVIVERHVGRSAELRVVLPDGTVGAEDALGAITGGCDDQLFNAVFAFGLDELGSIASLTDDAVRDHIFSAGVRGAGRSARAVRARLDGAARALWTPRSRTAEIDAVQSELEEVDAELKAARRVARAYPKHLEAERACRERVDALSADIERARADARRSETLLGAWPVWVRRQQADEQLAEVAQAPEVAEDALERLEALRSRLEAAEERLAELREERERVAAEREAVVIDDTLAAVVDEVRLIDEDRAAQRERIERLRALSAEQRKLADQRAAALAAFGPGWDDERIARTDASVPARGEVRDWQERTARASRAAEEAARELAEAEAEAEAAREQRGRADNAIAEAIDESAPPKREEIDERRSRLGELRAAMAERDAALAELAASERLAGMPAWVPPRWLGPAAAGVAAIGAVAAALADAGGTAAVLGVVAAGCLLATFALPARPASTADEDPLAPARARAERARAAVAGPAAALGQDADLSAADVEHAAAELDRAARARAELDALWASAREAARTLADREKERERAEATAERARAEVERTQQAWSEWCAARDLGDDRDPAAVVELFDAIDRLAEQRVRVAEVGEELAAVRTAVDRYAQRAARALTAAGRDPVAPQSQGDGDAGPDAGLCEQQLEAVRQLAADVAEDQRRRAQREQLAARLAEIEREQERHRRLATEREEELARLLAAVGADHEDAFREAASIARRRDRLVEQQQQAATDLDALLGTSGDADALRAELAAGDRAAWEAARDDAQQRLAELDAERDAALQELHRAEREREEVEGSERIAELDQRREALIARRDALVREWQVTTAAHALVGMTLDRFENERQPGVLRRAGEHFATTTEGAYTGLHQQGDDLLVRDERDRLWPVGTLSRGTAEQLYLCLRLALAEDLAARQMPLPFVMDDVLVNFDPGRARQVAGLLATVSKEGQVLYFTCHPHTAALLEETGAAAVFELPRGGGPPTPRGAAARAAAGD